MPLVTFKAFVRTELAVIAPAAKAPLTSRLTIVFAVFDEVAEFTDDATVVIVDELTPPTLFTIGNSAEPPKSFVNCKIPFTVDVASGAPEPPTNAETKAVVAICVELVPGAAVMAVGVPVNAGLEDNTSIPVPVELLVPVPPLNTLNGVVKLNVPDDKAVAVIAPTTKSPAPSLFTIVFAKLDDVAEFTAEATVVIVDDETPPTLFTEAAPVTSAVPLNTALVYAISPVVDIVLPVVNPLAVPLNVPVKLVDVTELSPVTLV